MVHYADEPRASTPGVCTRVAALLTRVQLEAPRRQAVPWDQVGCGTGPAPIHHLIILKLSKRHSDSVPRGAPPPSPHTHTRIYIYIKGFEKTLLSKATYNKTHIHLH